MNIKKMSGSLVAATLLLGLNTVAMADCNDVIADITQTADEIRFCTTTNDPTKGDAPIWQYKGKPSCVVNDKVSKKLYAERDESVPPRKNNPKQTHRGAANDFMDGKYDAGQQKLQDFIDTLMYAAKALDGQQGREDALVKWAVGVQNDAMAFCQ